VSITRRPKSGVGEAVDIDALINKGGSAPQQEGGDKDEVVALVLRLPADVLKEVDRAVKARRIRTPRHTWLLEAVHEKLGREAVDGA
jgi:hypothetical protein